MKKKYYIISKLSESFSDNKLEKFFLFNDLRSHNIDELKCNKFAVFNTENLKNGWNYIESKHDVYFDLIYRALNRINDQKLSQEFWQRAFSQGLLRQISILHQFFQQIESNFNPEKFKFRTLSKKSYIVCDTFEDQRNYFGGSYLGQEQLFSLYISCFYPEYTYPNFSSGSALSIRKTLSGFKFKIFAFLKFLFKKILIPGDRRPLSKNPCRLLLLGCYFDKKYITKLKKLSSNSIDYLPNLRNDKHYKANMRMRDMLDISHESSDPFDKFFFFTLKYLLPTHFVEGFNHNINYYNKLFLKCKNLKYIVSEAWLSHTNINLFRALAHEKRDVKTLYNEHNCLFHPFIGNFVNYVSKRVDKYLTFGWKTDDPKFISTSSLFPYKIKMINKIQNINILYVSYPASYYFPIYCSAWSNSGFGGINHLKFTKSFFESLPRTIRNEISYRGYPKDYSIAQLNFDKEVILERCLKGVKFVSSSKFNGPSCKEQMLSSRIVIIDFLSTSYLESLHMNIPTICFWDPESMSLKPEYSDFFDDLISAKIIHTNPVKAAKHLENVYNNPQTWWQSKEVQNLKDRWLERNFGKPDVLINYLLELTQN